MARNIPRSTCSSASSPKPTSRSYSSSVAASAGPQGTGVCAHLPARARAWIDRMKPPFTAQNEPFLPGGVWLAAKRISPRRWGVCAGAKQATAPRLGVSATRQRLPFCRRGIETTGKQVSSSRWGVCETRKQLQPGRLGVSPAAKWVSVLAGGVSPAGNPVWRGEGGQSPGLKRVSCGGSRDGAAARLRPAPHGPI